MKIYKIARNNFHYITNCVSSTAEKINSMIDHPSNREINYNTFMNYVSKEQLSELFPYYNWDNRGGLKLKDDWAVSYYKSVYENNPCVYMVRSAIEYIFADENIMVQKVSSYKGYDVGDKWVIGEELITDFYVNEAGTVFVETDAQEWYNFDDEMRKHENL